MSQPENSHRSAASVLVIDADAPSRDRVVLWLAEDGLRVRGATSAEQALQVISAACPEVVICSHHLPDDDGLALLERIRQLSPDTQVIMTAESVQPELVVQALRLGAADFHHEPFDRVMLTHAVRRASAEHRLLAENRQYRAELEAKNRELQDNLKVLKEDQEAGRAVQLKIMPSTHKVYGPVGIEFRIIPSLYLSGDFIDHFRISDTQIGFYLADVSGHGASSAFVTIMLKTMANRLRKRYQDASRRILMPAEIISRANEELLTMSLGKHLSVFCGLIDLTARQLVYCSASHFPPPKLFTQGETISLDGQGLPVGMFENPAYENRHVDLGDDFELWACSDGAVELLGHLPLKAKEALLLEKMVQADHNVDAFLASLGISSQSAVPDDIAVLHVIGRCE